MDSGFTQLQIMSAILDYSEQALVIVLGNLILACIEYTSV